MIFLGLIIDILAVLVAGGVGTMLRGKVQPRYQRLILQCAGLVALLAGCFGFLNGFVGLNPGDVQVSTGKRYEIEGGVLIVASILLGYMLGDAIDFDRLLDKIGHRFHKKAARQEVKELHKRLVNQKISEMAEPAVKGEKQKKKHRSLSEMPVYLLPSYRSGHPYEDGFVLATTLTCVGSFGIRAIAEIAATDNLKLMLIKAAVDAVLIFALCMVYGGGASMAVIPMGIMEAAITVLAIAAPNYLTSALVGQLTVIGAVIMIGGGISLCIGKKLRMANLFPAFFIPSVYTFLIDLIMKTVEK